MCGFIFKKKKKFRKTQPGSKVALAVPTGCMKGGERVGWGGLGTGSVDRHGNGLQPQADIPAVAAQGPVASLGVFTCTAAGET